MAGSLTASGCAFENNSAARGALLTIVGGLVLIESSRFVNNTSTAGSGVASFLPFSGNADDARVTLDSTLFEDNAGGCASAGIINNLPMVNVTVMRSTFRRCTKGSSSGPARTDLNGAALEVALAPGTSRLSVIESQFEGNVVSVGRQSAAQGGAVAVKTSTISNATAVVLRSTFSGNSARAVNADGSISNGASPEALLAPLRSQSASTCRKLCSYTAGACLQSRLPPFPAATGGALHFDSIAAVLISQSTLTGARRDCAPARPLAPSQAAAMLPAFFCCCLAAALSFSERP